MSVAPGGEWQAAYRGRSVFLTGHTGFKGSWLTAWLHRLGAEVTGYALTADTEPAMFEVLALERSCRRHIVADVRDFERLTSAVRAAKPDLVFHLAAQPLVGRSYRQPRETIETNVLGTTNLLEAIRSEGIRAAVVVVTTDKVYRNRDATAVHGEDDALGGDDPYAASKAAADLVVDSYRRSFFPPARLADHGVALATARAGNVIGGGDWSADRIVPDAIRALAADRPVPVRNPSSVRPWQHVLEPLSGYLLLGAKLAAGAAAERAAFCEAWNFGPAPEDARPVRDLVEALIAAWGQGRWEDRSDPAAPHESDSLRIATDKARARLGWRARWRFAEGCRRTVDWYRAHHDGADGAALAALTAAQIEAYLACETPA